MATELKRTEEYIQRLLVAVPHMSTQERERADRTLNYLQRQRKALKKQSTYKGWW